MLVREGRAHGLREGGRAAVGEHSRSRVAGAVAGIGIVACSLWGCRAELKSKALVEILKDWDMGVADVQAVYPAGRGVKTAARSFVDFFQKDIKARG